MADNNNVDWDSLSDDDFMNVLDSIETNPPGDGNLSDEVKLDEVAEETVVEDTDQYEDTGSEGEEVEAQPIETEEQVSENAEENAQDDTGDNEDTGSEEGNDEGQPEGEQGELNYQEEYQRLLAEKQQYEDFYNQVTGEFVANGKKVKGFDDPKKIIEAQQMAAGFSEKMAAMKPYRPFLKTLKDKGILDNPEKFNFAMSLLDGDTEAIKKHLKESNIDPMDIDLEDINYTEKNQLPNDIELALDDLIDNAGRNGVDRQVLDVVTKEWDDQSVVELLNDPQSSSDLISHISSGAFDLVKERMTQNRMTDVNGVYSKKPAIEQYREAAMELENEYVTYMQQKQEYDAYMAQQHALQQQMMQNPGSVEGNAPQYAEPPVAPPQAEARTNVNEARRKASSLSKKKRRTTRPKQVVDPLELNDDQFTDYLDSIIYK
jgi:hypothetical protein